MRISVMKPVNMILTCAIALCAGVTVWTQQEQPIPTKSAEVVQQARRYFFQAREGHFEVVPKAVALLEEAVAADPNNVALLNAMSFAYALQTVAASQPGGNPMDAVLAGQRAFATVERALKIDPDNADALATHGGMLGMVAQLQRRPELVEKSVAEIYRAVELAPSAVEPRLIRGMLGLNQPAQVRDTQATIDDVSFLIAAAEGSRAGDVEHMLLGDLYAEIGRADDARRQYQAAARRPASPVKDLVQSRLAALDRGAVPAEDIARLRASTGTCVTCHAK